MSKKEILINVFTQLKLSGQIKSMKDFADALDYHHTSISSAMNGRERYLTDSMFKRIKKVFPMVNPEYLKTGSGNVLLEFTPEQTTVDLPVEAPVSNPTETYNVGDLELRKLTEELAEQRELTKRAQEQTEKALNQIDQLIEIIKSVSLTPNNR